MFDRSNAAFDDEILTKLQLMQTRLSVDNAKRNPKPTYQICIETMQLWSDIYPAWGFNVIDSVRIAIIWS